METRHCFSFGPHYDPANTSFGPLVLHDEHRLAPGAGFAAHAHRGLDVVTWLLEGELVHGDSERRTVLTAGDLQVLRTGSGVVHSEHAGAEGARLVQLWLHAAAAGEPSYQQVVRDPSDPVAVVAVIGAAVVHAGRVAAEQDLQLPEAPLVHAFLAAGAVERDRVALLPGDSLRLRDAGSTRVSATAAAGLLVMEMHGHEPGADG